MKQTAVEWLIEELTKQNMFMHLFAKEIEQANTMFKEQIIDAYKFGLSDEYVIGSEQYYNENYGK
jgi:hypothetical protein